MIRTKTTNAGPVGLLPMGDYDPTVDYRFLMTVKYDHDSWICVFLDENGSPYKNDGTFLTIKGEAPSDESPYWKRMTDGGKHAYDEGETAKTKGNTAADKASLAQQKAQYATEQGDYAKLQGDKAKNLNEHPAYIADGTADKPGDANYWYVWDYLSQQYIRAAYAKGDDLDYSTMTEADLQRLIDNIKADLVFATPAECRAIVTGHQ